MRDDTQPEFPGPSPDRPEPAPPLCPGCDEPMRWVEAAHLWQCSYGGPIFVDENGERAEPPHDIGCLLCSQPITDHADGCPNGTPDIAQCGMCGEVLPVAELADHMNDEHGSQISREQIEETFVQAKAAAKKMLSNDHRELENLLRGGPLNLVEVWGAIGYHHVTGSWPNAAGFTPVQALTDVLGQYVQACDHANHLISELRALKTAIGHDPDQPFQNENIDLAKEPVPDGFSWNEEQQQWEPHCPYGCTDDQPFDCIHRPENP